MLGKLLKHEFRATGRVMLPLYIALAIISVFANLSTQLLDNSDNTALNIVAVLTLIIFGLGVMAVSVMAIVLMVQRFRDNLLTDEGYLMFTLPVSVHGLVWSKIIVSAVWFVATIAMIGLSSVILTFRSTYITEIFEFFGDIAEQLTAYYALNGAAIIIEAIVVVFLGCAAVCLMFYAAMSVGYGFTSHKVLLSVVFFFVFQFAAQFISVVCLGGIEFDSAMALNVMQTIHAAMFGVIIAELIYCAVFYVITTLSLEKRLNLQ